MWHLVGRKKLVTIHDADVQRYVVFRAWSPLHARPAVAASVSRRGGSAGEDLCESQARFGGGEADL